MNTFWLKIAVLAVVVLIGIILVSNFFSSEIDKATDLEAATERAEAAEAKLQDQLNEAQTQVEQKKEQKDTTITPAKTSPAPTRPPQTVLDDDDIVSSVEAERLYNLALTQYKIGRKIMTFKKMVDSCRELFDRYPNSPEAAKARVLMRNMPERYRQLYNVTDEELGLEK
ncbi:MAG: tetratricopeptide repeat protein [Planctomycetota bacterium]|jgi:TolA-binding protein